MTISEVNAMGKAEFLEIFGGVYEHSRWVAEGVVGQRPFGDLEQLAERMREVVEAAEGEKKMRLIRAHPDLAGKLGLDKHLTESSRREQQGAGLDQLTVDEFGAFSELNAAYRGKFGFPFVICVGRTDKAGILGAFQERLLNGEADEIAAALREVHAIARLRIEKISRN